MSIFAVEVPSQSRWAVYHSTTDTMFTPTFEAELPAVIFAACYSATSYSMRHGFIVDDYADDSQMGLAFNIRLFLAESFGENLGDCTRLPTTWCAILDPVPDPRWESSKCDVSDLVAALQEGRASVVNFALCHLEQWIARNRNQSIR